MKNETVEVSRARQALETAKIYWEAAIQCNASKDVVHKRLLDYKRAQEAFWCAIRKAR
jgi:hypothetical protein